MVTKHFAARLHSRAHQFNRSRAIRGAALESLESRRYFDGENPYYLPITKISGAHEGDFVSIELDFANAPWLPPYIVGVDSGTGWSLGFEPGIDFNWNGTIAPVGAQVDDNGVNLTISYFDGLDDNWWYWNPSVANVSPTASLGNSGNVSTGQTVTVSFSSQNDASSVDIAAGFTYSYDFNNDNDFDDPGEADSISSASRTTTFASAGNKVVHGRIYDKDGGFNDYYTTVTVTVTATTTAPTLTVSGSSTADEGFTYSLTLGSVVDPEGDTVSNYRVNWGDGSSAEVYTASQVTSASRVLKHVYSDDATPTITIDLQDADNSPGYYTGVASKSITVQNVAPYKGNITNDIFRTPTEKNTTITLAFSGYNEHGADAVRFSFAASTGALAANYCEASMTDGSSFSSGTVGTHNVYARLYDDDGGVSPIYQFRVYVYDDIAEDGTTWMTGAEPTYNYSSWESDGSSYCYDYAVDQHAGNWSGAVPGFQGGYTGNSWVAALEADKLVFINSGQTLAEAVEAKYTQTSNSYFADWTQFYTVVGWDDLSGGVWNRGMHWFRMDSDGYWSDKDGSSAPTKWTDPEFDPTSEDARNPALSMQSMPGFWAVKIGTVVTGIEPD